MRRWWAWTAIAAGVCLAQAPNARVLYQQAVEAKAKGQQQAALAKLQQATEADPLLADAWWLRAWVEIGLGRRQDALASFRRAADLLPPSDPRHGTAIRKINALAAEIEPVKQVVHLAIPPAVRIPPEPVPWLTGWPAALLALFAGGCAIAALLARYRDLQRGAWGPAARYLQLATGAAKGDARCANALLDLAERGGVPGLPRADLSLAVARAARANPEVRRQLAECVRNGQGIRRRVAALALSEQNDQPDPTIWRPLLALDDPDLRRAALLALARSPDPDAVSDLRRIAVGGGDAGPLAVAALAATPGDAAAAALLEVCRRAEPTVAAAAAGALASRETLPPGLAEPLADLLAERGFPARQELVRALGRIGSPAAEPLLAALTDADAGVRAAAREALLDGDSPRWIPTPAPFADWLPKLAADPSAATGEALAVAAAYGGEEAVPVLVAVLQADAEGAPGRLARAEALRLLVANGSAEAARAVLQALAALPPSAADTPLRAHIRALLAAVGEIRPAGAILVLLERAALDRDDPTAWSIARQLAPENGAAIADAVRHDSAKVRRLAARLVSEFPAPEAAEALSERLERSDPQRPDWEFVLPAAEALAALGANAARESLRRLRDAATDEAADRLDVALALLSDESAQRRVEAMLVRDTWSARRPAAAYFRRLPTPPRRARDVIAEADAHAAVETAWERDERSPLELAAHGEWAKPTLEAWLHLPERRWAAAEALAILGDETALRRAARFDEIERLAAAWRDDEAAREALASALGEADEPTRAHLVRLLGATVEELLGETRDRT